MDRAAVPTLAGAAGARAGFRQPRVNKRECRVLEPKPGGPARLTGGLGSAGLALKQLTGRKQGE